MKTKTWCIIALFSFPLHIFFTSSAYALTHIMPLGDSITQGYASGEPYEARQVSYRKALWDKLAVAGYDIDFVGSRNSGSEILGGDAADHEGHPGWHAAGHFSGNNLLDFVYDWLVTQDPPTDVVLLHAGTNDISAGGESASEIGDILEQIDLYEENLGKDVWVVLALIINRACCEDPIPCDECDATTFFNDSVYTMAASRMENGDKIVIVDMEVGAGIDYRFWTDGGEMDDIWHPYQDPTTGEAPAYAKMADVWFSALDQLLCKGDYDDDGDVDGSDLAVFAADFGRTNCDSGEACEGDFDLDNDVDGSDLAAFSADFGRTDCP